MAYDVFMYFTGGKGNAGTEVKGETQDKEFASKNAFEIYSYSFGASNPVTIGSGSGGSGGGKVSISSFNIMKKTDLASGSLFAACCKGDHFDEATVVLRKAGGGSSKDNIFLTYTFKEVFVESIQWSGSAGGDNTPTESVSFAFGSVKIEYMKQDAKGKLSKGNEQSWSITQNDAAFAV